MGWIPVAPPTGPLRARGVNDAMSYTRVDARCATRDVAGVCLDMSCVCHGEVERAEDWVDTSMAALWPARARRCTARTHGFCRTAHPRVPEPRAGVHHDPVHDARRTAVHPPHGSLAVSAARAMSVAAPGARGCRRAAQSGARWPAPPSMSLGLGGVAHLERRGPPGRGQPGAVSALVGCGVRLFCRLRRLAAVQSRAVGAEESAWTPGRCWRSALLAFIWMTSRDPAPPLA